MRLLIVFVFIAAGLCRAADTAADLIRHVAATAQSAPAWHTEGTVADHSRRPDHAPPDEFRFWMQSPGQTRFEQTGSSTPVVIVCNGPDAVVYSPPLHRFRKQPATPDICSPIVTEWRALPDRLESAAFAGACGSNPSEKTADYILVKGFSEPELASVGRIGRTLCIDSKRGVIAWERWDSRHTVREYIYSTADPDAKPAPELLAFDLPPGSSAWSFSLPIPRLPGTRAIPEEPGTSSPQLVSKVEPKYGEPSRKAGIQGTVLLYVIIAANGKASDILVYRPLTPDLDREAVRCIGKWRFTPSKRNGKPVATTAMIEVNFRLQ